MQSARTAQNLTQSVAYSPTTRQLAFHAGRRECLRRAFVGGVGAGKSVAVRWEMLWIASTEPGSKWLVGTDDYRKLEKTTMREFNEQVPAEMIIKRPCPNSEEAIIATSDPDKPSTIIFAVLDDPHRLSNYNLSGVLIEDAHAVTEACAITLLGRLRHSGPGITRHYLVSANPRPGDWVWRWFVKDAKEIAPGLYHKPGVSWLVQVATADNSANLPADYIENMLATRGPKDPWVQQNVFGKFNVYPGKIYDFDRRVHVCEPFDIPESWPRVIGIDHGINHPTAAAWMAAGPEGEVYYYRDYREKNLIVSENTANILALGAHDPAPKVVVIDGHTRNRDAAGGDSVFDLYEAAFGNALTPSDVQKGCVAARIARTREYLHLDPARVNPRTGAKGSPRMWIFRTCERLIEEREAYHAVVKERDGVVHEEPQETDDDLEDAAQYATEALPIRVHGAHAPPSESADQRLLREHEAWMRRSVGSTGVLTSPAMAPISGDMTVFGRAPYQVRRS